MGKQQLSTIDVAAEVSYLRRRVIGMYLINVFDINPKTYILKLGTSGDAGEKVFLLLESGCRLHTTQYDRQRSEFPSNMNLKLRKHIRNKRLNDIQQLGVDRIVDFTFGQGDKAIHLILEIYAQVTTPFEQRSVLKCAVQGNLVLTNHKYEVLTLLRTHSDAETEYVLLPKRPYPVQHIRLPRPVSESDVTGVLSKTQERRSLKAIVTELLPFGSACAEHVLLSAGIDPKDKLPEEKGQSGALMEEGKMQRLMKQIKLLEEWFHTCSLSPPAGFILTKEAVPPTGQENQGQEGKEVYLEFEPFLLYQHRDKGHRVFETFDAALDEFFSQREGQKIALAEAAAQQAAEARLLKTKDDLESRERKLRQEATHEDLQAQLIEYHQEEVDEVLLAVNSVQASGMSWSEVEALIKNEAENGNPVAGRIYSLQLEQNAVTLLLEDRTALPEDESSPRYVKVTVDLSLGAAANARLHYDKRKKHASKAQKTHEANATAIKAAEAKVQAQLKKTMPAGTMHHLRKMHWFEKFHWFITSENYLVVSGRDAQQNELLVKRYMKKDDVYVHADLHGASTTIVKNYRPGMEVAPMSLQQAGSACVCRSKAWDGKVITSAWWVYAHQVSKTAPTGEYLTTGSFMIRGKKNYLPPASLIYGLAFLFKLETSCIERHRGDRLCRMEEELLKKDEVSVHEEQDASASEEEQGEKSALDIFLDESVDRLAAQLRQNQQEQAESTSQGRGAETRSGTEELFPHQSGKREGLHAQPTGQLQEKHRATSELLETKQKSPVRGKPQGAKKKGKNRRMDAEDLQIMTELLQSAGQKKTRQQRRDERKQKKAAKRANLHPQRNPEAEEQEIKDTIARATETPFATEDVQDDAQSSSSETPAESDVEDAADLVSSHQAEIQQLDSMTGNPLAEDTLLFAVPCCAPYDALQNFKYKVKMLPGNLKKGKAGRQAVELLVHSRDVPERDLRLMKDVPETEVTNVMLGGVKLAMPGMQKIKQSQKSKKKKS